jgi:hypothetical protein
MRRLRLHHLEPRDPEGPCGKTGSRLKIRRLALHDKKCLLEHILRGGKIREQRENEPFDSRLMAHKELKNFLHVRVVHSGEK